MIARRRRDDAARALRGIDVREKVVRAAELERAAALQHLRLDPDRRTEALGQRVGRQQRRAHGDRREHARGGLEVAKRHQLHVNHENTRFRPAVFAR